MVDSKLDTILNSQDDGIVRIIPESWTQIDAIFNSIQVDDFDITLKVYLPKSEKQGVLSYPKDSEEGIILYTILKDWVEGKRISLLTTDISSKRLIIKEC